MSQQPATPHSGPDLPLPAAPEMTVTVRDRSADAENWGNGTFHVVLRTVTIPARCPVCGRPRGEPTWKRDCEDGDYYSVNVWQNPCGHVDKYSAVLKEAAAYANQS